MKDVIEPQGKKLHWHFLWILVFVVFLLTSCAKPVTELTALTSQSEEELKFSEVRQQLTEHAIALQGLKNEDVIRSLNTVPRHRFVLSEHKNLAYDDNALPIGYGQTISQPSLVAYMTELLELKPGERVLEIGTGSGYQAAILAELGYVEVYSIEIVPELYDRSTKLLKELGYIEVQTRQADGYYGWEEAAPFDAIIVTAAPDHLPAPLAEQLKEGGVMVIPIGPQGFYQSLWKFVKEKGEMTAYNMGSVAFVPFTGDAGGVPLPTP